MPLVGYTAGIFLSLSMDFFNLPIAGSSASLLIGTIISLVIQYAPKVILAFVTLVGGFYFVNLVGKILDKALSSRRIDRSLSTFLESIAKIGLKILVLVSVISMLGVQVSSLVALIGATGLAVGLGLQGALGNFAGGVLILFFKPFKVGDLIENGDYLGVVERINVVNTMIRTLDNKLVVVPNGNISNETIQNFSMAPNLRVSLKVGIGYEDDIKKAKEILLKIATNMKNVVILPEPYVGVAELGDSSVVLELRVWVKQAYYFKIKHELNELIKMEFDKERISIPYPIQTLKVERVNVVDKIR